MKKELLDKVFHAYDIRGTVGEQLNEDFFYHLGKAFVTFLDAKKIAVGYDIRPESKIFSESFIKGVLELGCDVVKINEIATEMLYFAVGSDKSLDGGVTITASHNPAGWNGCKMVGAGVKAISSDSGLKEIKEMVATESYKSSDKTGVISSIDIYPAFKKHILSHLDGVSLPKLKVIVDAGNGIGGKVYDYVFGDLDFEVEKMYFEPDGNFPNHVPDPLKEENVKEIKQKVLDNGADLGIAIDGDADRVFFIDSKGRNPSGVFMSSLFAKHFAEVEKGARIVHDPRVTWPVSKEIAKYGATPLVNKAGHSFFKDRMKAEDAIFGGEMSAHFFYRDFFYADSGMMTIVTMLELIGKGMDLAKELDYLYNTYIVSGEVNYKVDNVDLVIENVRKSFEGGNVLEIDGLTIEFEDWRFNLRKSNTEPVIRLNLEGTNIAIVKENFEKIEKVIAGVRQNTPQLKELK